MYAAADSTVRIRDQSQKARRSAILAWRARAREPLQPTTPPAIEQPITIDVKELACNRFIYDFSQHTTGLSSIALGEHYRAPRCSGSAQGRDPGLEASFVATALSNFHVRHCDSRAASLASIALGKAFSTLSNSLQSSDGVVTQDIALTAVLLGLQQVCFFVRAASTYHMTMLIYTFRT